MFRLFKRKYVGILLLLMTVCLTAGCGKEETQEDNQTEGLRNIIDGNKRDVQVPKEVKSVVCLGVGSLRFTTYLDAVDFVVGIEQNEVEKTLSKPYNYVNNETLVKLPVVGNNGEAYEEELLKLKPDVIVASFDKETAEKLQNKLEIPVVTIPIVDNLYDEHYLEVLSIMGELYQKEDRAKEIKAYIEELKQDLDTRTITIDERDRPLIYVGGVSFKGAHGIDGTEGMYFPFTAINATNLADESGKKEPYNIDIESVIKRNPDILFIDYNGLELAKEDYNSNKELFENLKAIKNGQIYSQISYRFSALNVELALTDAYYAGKVVYPEAFKDIDIEEKSEEIFRFFLGEDYYKVLEANGMKYEKISLEK